MEPLMSSRYHLAVAGNHEMTQTLGGVIFHGAIVAMYVPKYPLVNDHIAGWKIPIFNREYIFKRFIFHCHVSLPEGIFKFKLRA